MNPGSFPYFILVAITLFLYYLIRNNQIKQWLLLLSSLVFISYFGLHSAIAVVLFSGINFYYGNWAVKKGYTFNKLVFINGLNIAILLISRFFTELKFAQLPFFVEHQFNGKFLAFMGIGFYSLQLIAYQIDLYKKRFAPDNELVGMILGNAFFARVSSGPFMSIQAFQKQLADLPKSFTEANFTLGLQRILLGLIKKLVIAERLSAVVDRTFGNMQEMHSGYGVASASILYTIELYFDFSGYIDIALGTAQLFGIKLNENFNSPFQSSSISEWWRRWHITLINWFTQYIYYPVAYRFRSKRTMATYIAIATTFSISALWHGLGVTYMIWGGLHVLYLIIETYLKKPLSQLQQNLTPAGYKIIFIPITVLLVSFSHLFFRSNNIEDAGILFRQLIDLKNFLPQVTLGEWLTQGEQGSVEYAFNIRLGLVFAILYLFFEAKILNWVKAPEYKIYRVVVLILILTTLGVFDKASRFIYMQF